MKSSQRTFHELLLYLFLDFFNLVGGNKGRWHELPRPVTNCPWQFVTGRGRAWQRPLLTVMVWGPLDP